MLIEVKETHPPKAANRSGTVVAMDGQKFDCWPTTMRNIQVGRWYEVQTSTNDRGYTSITRATLVNDAAPAPAPPTAPAPIASGEAEFVARLLGAMILKGEVAPFNKRQMADATLMLRGLYQHARFDEPLQPMAQAAE